MNRYSDSIRTKTSILIVVCFAITLVIISRLFYLQVIRYDYYKEVADKEHQGYTELPARRGEIFISDHHSGDHFRIATNTTLNLLFADPTLIKSKHQVAETIAPLIYNEDEERKKENEIISELKKILPPEPTEEQLKKVLPSSKEELYQKFYQDLLNKISQDKRPQILLAESMPEFTLNEISSKKLQGIEVKMGKLYAYPPQIFDQKHTANILSPYLGIPKARLERILLGENRYVILKKKLPPDIAEKIKEIKVNDENKEFLGINMKEEYYRYYPEEQLAANLLGFVDHKGNGQYGIENKFNKELRGKKGIFQTLKDSIGRQITVGESVIKPAENGQKIYLTIDRSVQMEVEKILRKTVRDKRADSGQIVVMEPATGKIVAMAHYPTFNPNEYSEVFAKEIITLNEEEIESLVPIGEEENPTRFYFYRNVDTDDKFEIFKEVDDEGTVLYKRYKNFYGPIVYRNNVVSGIYEPGSVFKSLTMAIAIDDKDITPNTTFNEDGPIEVDEFEIKNALDKYRGLQTMTQALENSSNTAMAFVSKRIGRTLFYSYLKKFGFSERTDIEFNNEHPGQLEHFTKWAESELITRAFGQGVAATPIQVTTAYSVLANKGLLMRPYIIDKVENANGELIADTDEKILHRVISEKSAETITAMLVSSVENGIADRAQVKGHYVAGKTGTSQTYKHGKPLEGPGTTIASFAGYGPIDNPKFVILVKVDRPRTDIWGSSVAAPLFSEVAAYLFKYYNIPPDKNY